ncbi:MAG: DUF5522 domain-containing protein [Bacteroidia bacterium]
MFKPKPSAAIKLVEGEDFYFNEHGLMVFTARYHQKRGYCCKSGCRHCPYGYGQQPGPQKARE